MPGGDYGQRNPEAAEKIRELEARIKTTHKAAPVPFVHDGLLRFNADIPAEHLETLPEGVVCR
jgi:hypothetical protein